MRIGAAGQLPEGERKIGFVSDKHEVVVRMVVQELAERMEPKSGGEKGEVTSSTSNVSATIFAVSNALRQGAGKNLLRAHFSSSRALAILFHFLVSFFRQRDARRPVYPNVPNLLAHGAKNTISLPLLFGAQNARDYTHVRVGLQRGTGRTTWEICGKLRRGLGVKG